MKTLSDVVQSQQELCQKYQGLTTDAAVNRLKTEYKSSLRDPDEESVFWLALADTGWRLGRLDDNVLQNALRVIDTGQDLAKWEDADRRKREQVLAKLRIKLQSAPPSPKPVAKRIKSANEWKTGEVIGFRLLSGRWVLLRVIGHHEDRGGKSAVCELLNWMGESLSSLPTVVDKLSIRKEAGPRGISQFLFQEPRSKRDQARVVRTGIVSKPAQRSSGYGAFVWPFVDRLFREVFELE